MFRRRFFVILALALQVLLLIYIIVSGSRTSVFISLGCTVLSLIVALFVATKKSGGAYKQIWIFMILLFPILGGLLYIFFNFQRSSKRVLDKINDNTLELAPYFQLSEDTLHTASEEDMAHASMMTYLQNTVGYPVYPATAHSYYSPVEDFFPVMLAELEKAEKFIFLEYFIIENGYMWDTILEVLERKAAAGVDVRLMYDDMGCFTLLPSDYPKQLEAKGIKCRIFNPFRPVLTSTQNNRDHRKICVIDGITAVTGGFNLADEYINKAKDRDYYWKDSAITVTGNCARAFALIFLQLWKLLDDREFDISLIPQSSAPTQHGFMQPYADCPSDSENVSEAVYLDIINSARKYVYIDTPYLILDENFIAALGRAAKSGVDVRIIVPEHGDSRIIHFVTKSYYKELLEDGVRIFEYKNSFVHSKLLVSDDTVASVGTANLDFRSLYLQFECGVLLYGTDGVLSVRDDAERIFKNSRELTVDDCKAGVLKTLVQHVLKLFAPLM